MRSLGTQPIMIRHQNEETRFWFRLVSEPFMLGYPVVGFRRDIVYFIPREVSFRVNCVGFKYEMLSVHNRIYISDDHNGVAAQTM